MDVTVPHDDGPLHLNLGYIRKAVLTSLACGDLVLGTGWEPSLLLPHQAWFGENMNGRHDGPREYVVLSSQD